ncbi:MAG: ribosomal protein L13e [Thaumarchaeota archaeon]|jgi:large subunit ribosomal protein L13e|nr:ribosomal protein L13e [Candidatus Geocrenenecus arthurdayi]MCL7388963.1 ribosomal protein L13e [Candidatus Geocrenenecus arthurdayi]MCL7390947.1 ribosomal protein L13e [Candidatus Geocrenenecus arthurdayi]MCL7397086.1 ribosomal protein L13e [Candidatus Geocrenenecus arthurdayi]MCL7402372.1 ribosomal protein L13e [Candidatus Geocrenenecus arthurdayi]
MERPNPIVRRKHLDVLKVRVGRGFSINELKEVNLSIREARKMGLYIDERRKSMHSENVEVLRNYLSNLRPLRKGE